MQANLGMCLWRNAGGNNTPRPSAPSLNCVAASAHPRAESYLLFVGRCLSQSVCKLLFSCLRMLINEAQQEHLLCMRWMIDIPASCRSTAYRNESMLSPTALELPEINIY